MRAPKELTEFCAQVGAALPEGHFAAFGESVLLVPDALPELRGLSYEQARAALAECGLYLRDDSGILGGDGVTVVSQSREAGSTVGRGSVVGVNLSDSGNLGRY